MINTASRLVNPTSATERGRQVLAVAGSQFLVDDHDFTTFSLIPSVILHIDIPDNISGSWYTGQVHIGLKDGALHSLNWITPRMKGAVLRHTSS